MLAEYKFLLYSNYILFIFGIVVAELLQDFGFD